MTRIREEEDQRIQMYWYCKEKIDQKSTALEHIYVMAMCCKGNTSLFDFLLF